MTGNIHVCFSMVIIAADRNFTAFLGFELLIVATLCHFRRRRAVSIRLDGCRLYISQNRARFRSGQALGGLALIELHAHLVRAGLTYLHWIAIHQVNFAKYQLVIHRRSEAHMVTSFFLAKCSITLPTSLCTKQCGGMEILLPRRRAHNNTYLCPFSLLCFSCQGCFAMLPG